jgi:hypothetical protein
MTGADRGEPSPPDRIERIARLFLEAAESDERDFTRARAALLAEVRAMTERCLPSVQDVLDIEAEKQVDRLRGLASFRKR